MPFAIDIGAIISLMLSDFGKGTERREGEKNEEWRVFFTHSLQLLE